MGSEPARQVGSHLILPGFHLGEINIFHMNTCRWASSARWDGGFCNQFCHSRKKRKDSLEGSLVRVLFAAKLEFPKILVHRLPQNTSNGNIESTEKSTQP